MIIALCLLYILGCYLSYIKNRNCEDLMDFNIDPSSWKYIVLGSWLMYFIARYAYNEWKDREEYYS